MSEGPMSSSYLRMPLVGAKSIHADACWDIPHVCFWVATQLHHSVSGGAVSVLAATPSQMSYSPPSVTLETGKTQQGPISI